MSINNAFSQESFVSDIADILDRSNEIISDSSNLDMNSLQSGMKHEGHVLHKQKVQLYVFVSLVMDKSLIRKLAQEAKKHNAVLVLRGLKNNNFKETVQILAEFVREYKVGFSIDPELFVKYEVKLVPSYVVTETKDCPANKSCNAFDKITGNVTIDYFLDKVSKDGDLRDKL